MKRIPYCSFYDVTDEVKGWVWAEPFHGFYIIKKRKYKACCKACGDVGPRFLSDKPVLIIGIDLSYKQYFEFLNKEDDENTLL